MGRIALWYTAGWCFVQKSPRLVFPASQWIRSWFWSEQSHCQQNLMSMAFHLFCFMALLMIPLAVLSSVFISVASWGHPIASRLLQSATASCPLRQRAPDSVSAAEAMTFLITLANANTSPLNVFHHCRSSNGTHPHCFVPQVPLGALHCCRHAGSCRLLCE